ncbi:MAG TPA: NTP transferase domain-containing protein [Gemmatimonadales bacterium]|nr:NTP transferase domain-containing protein [Gemmatimonadales bacterium]
MRAIITAAGRGSRLASSSEDAPKTLLPCGSETILATIMRNFATAGIAEFIVVVGFQGETIVEYLAARANLGFAVTIVRNAEWRRGNGISVHRASTVLGPDEEVLLSMADHLVSPDALRSMITAPPGRNRLLVDSRIALVHDLDDATKVRVDGKQITQIGKEIAEFNAVDCGIFRLTPRYFEAMGRQIARGHESITEGVRELIAAEDFEAVPIPPSSNWIDIDTAAAYEHAVANLARYTRDGTASVRG